MRRAKHCAYPVRKVKQVLEVLWTSNGYEEEKRKRIKEWMHGEKEKAMLPVFEEGDTGLERSKRQSEDAGEGLDRGI